MYALGRLSHPLSLEGGKARFEEEYPEGPFVGHVPARDNSIAREGMRQVNNFTDWDMVTSQIVMGVYNARAEIRQGPVNVDIVVDLVATRDG